MNEKTRGACVFVSQDNERNYAAAERYGTVVILSNREIVAYSASAHNASTAAAIVSRVAKDYVPGVDSLLPAGGVLSIALMLKAAFDKPGDHRLLKWDRHAQTYHAYWIRQNGKGESDGQHDG